MPYYEVRLTVEIDSAKNPREAVEMVLNDLLAGEELSWEVRNAKDALVADVVVRAKAGVFNILP